MPENNLPNKPNSIPSPVTRVTSQTITEISSGPIPPPQVLQQYNNIIPNAAERILRMAEKQSDHRMDLERRVIYSNIRKSYLGMTLATGIAIFGLYIAYKIAVSGNPATAGIIAALDLGGLISIAVYNTRAQRKERENKREQSAAFPARKKEPVS